MASSYSMYRLCIRCCSQEKGNKEEDIEDGDEEKGEQAVQGEVELNPSDVGDQVGDHREEVWDVGLARDLVL